MDIGGFAGAAKGNNARRNDQATEGGQTGCADSASLQAACSDKPKVTLDKSARFGESRQPATIFPSKQVRRRRNLAACSL
jgi:hypothetical protein